MRVLARWMCIWGVAFVLLGLNAAAAPLKATLLKGGLPGENAALIDALAGQLKEAGYEVAFMDADGLCNPAVVNAKSLDLLVLSNAASLPSASVAPIEKYLKDGGNIIALNAPLWQTLLIKPADKWVSRSDYEKQTAGALPEHVLFSFKPEDIANWKRACNTTEGATTYETVEGGPTPGQRAFHAKLSNLQGWDNYGPMQLDHPFPEGHTLTVFSAKGGDNTSSLAIEWQEKDGSRWIATVPLSSEWRRYVLTPADFKYWESVPARRNDQLHPENVVRMNIGLAFTHTGMVGGPHEYWVGPFGTAKTTPELEKILARPAIPTFDLLSPGYKFFDSHDVAGLHAASQISWSAAPISVPKDIKSVQPRPGGGGLNKGCRSDNTAKK